MDNSFTKHSITFEKLYYCVRELNSLSNELLPMCSQVSRVM